MWSDVQEVQINTNAVDYKVPLNIKSGVWVDVVDVVF